MLPRLILVLVTLFWMTMNYLLWRSEFGSRNLVGSSVPVEVVWRKILTEPDGSDLAILHHNRPIGHGKWSANIRQNPGARRIIVEEFPPEAAPEAVAGYRIDFAGTLSLNDVPGRLSYDFSLKMATNQAWQEFGLTLKLHSAAWRIHSLATEQTIHIKEQDESEKSERIFTFADLQNPQALARQLDLPIPLEIFGVAGLSPKPQTAAPSPGLIWEAWNDWVTIGHTSVRAFRLQCKLFDRYQIVVIVSQVGEILRVELPDGWLLLNDQFNL